jgi:hypothetical protein
MKKRYSLIFTITAAAILVSSIAYASKKKLQTKSEPLNKDMSEVDLAANLIDADKWQTLPKKSNSNKHDDGELKDLTMIDKSKFPDKVTGK